MGFLVFGALIIAVYYAYLSTTSMHLEAYLPAKSIQADLAIVNLKEALNNIVNDPASLEHIGDAIQYGSEYIHITRGKLAYNVCIQFLKDHPNDPNIRQVTLEIGITYSNAIRDGKGVTIFDEMALNNDINAATGHSTLGTNDIGKVEVTNSNALSNSSIADEIKKLAELLVDDIITAEEFARGKEQFLGTEPNKAAEAIELVKSLHSLFLAGSLTESEFNMKKWDILSDKLIK